MKGTKYFSITRTCIGERHPRGITNFLQLIGISNQPFKRILSFDTLFEWKSQYSKIVRVLIIHMLIDYVQDVWFPFWIMTMRTSAKINIQPISIIVKLFLLILEKNEKLLFVPIFLVFKGFLDFQTQTTSLTHRTCKSKQKQTVQQH